MSLDIDAACSVLQKLQEKIGSPPGTEPLRTAAIALHFIWGSGHLHNFEDYLACFNQGDSPPPYSSSDTREQAEASLQQPMEPRRAHSVAITGTRYSVGYSLERGVRFLLRIPESAGLTTTTQAMDPPMREAFAVLRQARAHAHSHHGARVEIAGQRYSVGYSRDSGLRMLVRGPTLEESGLTEQGE